MSDPVIENATILRPNPHEKGLTKHALELFQSANATILRRLTKHALELFQSANAKIQAGEFTQNIVHDQMYYGIRYRLLQEITQGDDLDDGTVYNNALRAREAFQKQVVQGSFQQEDPSTPTGQYMQAVGLRVRADLLERILDEIPVEDN